MSTRLPSAQPPREPLREKACVFFAHRTVGQEVVRGLIARGELDVRCCVHNLKDPVSIELKDIGGDVVEVNPDDRDSIRQAVRGCSCAYLAQDSLNLTAEQEIRRAKLVTQVAKEAGIGLQHHFGLLVHITMPQPPPGTSNEIINRKAEVDAYLTSCDAPWSCVELGVFYDHFLPGGLLEPTRVGGNGTQGSWKFSLPIPAEAELPLISKADAGLIIARMFENKNKYLRRRWLVASETISMGKFVQLISTALGQQVSYEYVPGEQWLNLSPEKELLFDLMYIFTGRKNEIDMAEWRRLNANLQDSSKWIQSSWNIQRDISA